MTIEPGQIARVPEFHNRVDWFIDNRADLRRNVACMRTPGQGKFRLLSIVWKERLVEILEKLLDEKEFYGTHGIRSLSRHHREHPYDCVVDGRASSRRL